MFFFILFISAVFAWAQNPRDIVFDSFEEVAGRGLVIRSNPSGVRVFINGIERGFTPLSLDSLLPGEYILRLTRDDYKDKEFPVTLFSTSRLIVSVKMEKPQGLVQITVLKSDDAPEDLPFNPLVTVNSLFLSSALKLTDNKTELLLPFGRHVIRARAQGWEDVDLTVMLQDEGVVPVVIVMRPR